ncbi:MAG: hypothetical protein PHU63_03765, partial [Candidatus ainarchaeum sp.]|nr:hypothetical protein [Candidatus ainarchaeum sp.]
GNNGGECEFNTPTGFGEHIYFACSDLDEDGTKEFDKKSFLIEDEERCTVGCTPEKWSSCICNEGESIGKQKGICMDDCGNNLEYEQNCECILEQEENNEEIETNLDKKEGPNLIFIGGILGFVFLVLVIYQLLKNKKSS